MARLTSSGSIWQVVVFLWGRDWLTWLFSFHSRNVRSGNPYHFDQFIIQLSHCRLRVHKYSAFIKRYPSVRLLFLSLKYPLLTVVTLSYSWYLLSAFHCPPPQKLWLRHHSSIISVTSEVCRIRLCKAFFRSRGPQLWWIFLRTIQAIDLLIRYTLETGALTW